MLTKAATYPGGRGAWGTVFNGLGPEPPDIVRGIINPDVAPSDVFIFVGGREPILDPSFSEVADGEPLTDTGLHGVSGGGREGLGGLEGLKPPFESDGELFPLTFLFSPVPESSGSSDPFGFVLGKKRGKGGEN